MRAIKATAAALAMALCLSGCGDAIQGTIESLPEGAQNAVIGAMKAWSDRRWSLQDPIDAFFAAVDARDAEAVRAMFSPNVQAEDEDLEESIQKLFALYPGPTEDCEMRSPVGSSQHIGWRENMTRVHNVFPVVCQGISYYCSFAYTTKDEADEGNVGLTYVVFKTEKVQANTDFLHKLDLANGLTVIEDCPGDYETRRIGDSPYIFTPIDRTITQTDLTDFLEEEDLWDAFTARFGPPNAESWLSVYYELVPEDGRTRYAHIYTKDYGGVERVSSVYLYNDRDYQPIGTIWKTKADSDATETEDST